jgi:hypothetical protein
MNFTTFTQITQPSARWLLLALAATGVACGSGGGAGTPQPTNPEATVISFLSAVRDRDMEVMESLWGSSSGPASDRMDNQTLEQRLTVIRIYLAHDEYTIVPRPSEMLVDAQAGEQVVYVRLTRNGCTPTVPFTVAPDRGGGLIRNIDLQAAGKPERRCQR